MRPSIATSIFVFFLCLTFTPKAQISESAPSPPPAKNNPATPPGQQDTAAMAGRDSLPPIDSMPRLLEFVKAEYPAEFVKKGIEGQVTLDLLVDTAGIVDSVAVVKGFNRVLDSCAAVAAKKFRFRPAIAAHAPVPVLMEYSYRFTLDEVVDKIERYVNLNGRLLERGTRQPVRDAAIAVLFRDTTADKTLTVPFSAYLKKIGSFGGQHVEGLSVITATDSAGRFSFTSLPAGPITVKVICAGYEQLMENETLHPAEITEVTYHIQRFSNYGDNEVVVYGKAEEKEVAKRTLTLNEVRKVPGFSGDAVKVVQALPGVARASFISGDIVVRGAGNSDSRFYLDGVQIPVLFHFGGLKSTYNSDALESVDFYPGGFGTRYGDVTAGVVEIKGRPAKADRVHGLLDASFYDASFLVEGPVTKSVSVLLSARRSFIGDILSWAISKMDLPYSVQPYYWDYICRTDYAASKDMKFYLTLFGSQDQMKLITRPIRGGISTIGGSDQLNTHTLFHMGIAGWDWTISPAVKNMFTYSLTYADMYASIFGFAKWDQQAYLHSLRNQTSVTVAKNATLNIGLDAQVYPVNFYLIMQSSADTVSRDTMKNWVFGDLGPYLNLDWKPLPRLEIIPGIRYDYFPELKYRGGVVPAYWNYSLINNHQGAPGEPSARLTLRYKLTDAHTVKAAVGNYSQTPQPTGQTIMEKWGDPYLPATKAVHYVGGYEWQITDLIHADVQAYYNNQWDIPRPATLEDYAEGSTKGYYADEKGRMYGLEIMLKHDQGKRFFGWLAYSLSRSERRDPHSGKWSLYSKDETHNLQLVGSYRLPKFWEIGGRLRYVTGDPTTPIDGIGYNEGDGYFYRIYGPQNSARMDPFFQLDVRVEKKFMFKNWIMAWYLDIQDLSYFVYKSPEFYQYNYRSDPNTKTPVGAIIYPALGLSAEF